MLTKGGPAPPFALKDATGKEWSLDELSGRRVLLYFYPIDDTPGCTAEACDFRDSHHDWQQAGYVVLGVSPQDAESHTAFAGKYDLNFPLLIDSDLSVARAYGAVRDEQAEYQGMPLVIKRSTFVIDENGRIEHALYGVQGKGHVADLKQLLSVPAGAD